MNFNCCLFRIVACAIVFSVLWSCETEKLLDLDYYSSESKLAVFGNFETDSSLVLNVYYSDKLSEIPYSPGDYKLRGVQFELLCRGELLELSDSIVWYQTQNKISAGLDYRAKIYYEGYDTVYADFLAPKKVLIDSVTALPYSDTNYIKAQIWFNDNVGEMNGYGIQVNLLQQKRLFLDYMYDPPQMDSNITDYRVYFHNIDPLLSNIPQFDMETLFSYEDQEEFRLMNYTDEKFDGEHYGLVLLLNRKYKQFGVYSDLNDTLCFELSHIDEGYYNFLEKSRAQLFDLNNSFVQPQNIPSNIENGYGYIGGYATDYFKIAVKDLVNETKTK